VQPHHDANQLLSAPSERQLVWDEVLLGVADHDALADRDTAHARLPRALRCCTANRVRSEIRSRSSWANEARSRDTKRPIAPVVSIDSEMWRGQRRPCQGGF
jgi:hypothetical protein